ncbi:hypothetical protein [Sulfitobacter sp. 1A12157]|uniref:hypothetical protein n=1 Tax=Sulfitobacter sp. 1A12157 TaxID=3368594 RepID=UPI00374548BB
MTNANALPIKVATDETVSMAHYNAAMDAKDARIDALKKALELADARFHMHGMATMTERLEEYGYEHEAQVHGLEDHRAALGEGD